MRWLSLLFMIVPLSGSLQAQNELMQPDFSLLEYRVHTSAAHTDSVSRVETKEEFPTPKSVLYKSMMIPGWGQIENRQAWKVPIVYGLFAGVGYYTWTLNNQYSDYRAAFYNQSRGEESDFRFGPTPERLLGINPQQLQSARDSFRNQRDFMFVVMALTYGLNILDAYVYAHMRSFDVSDDLSATTYISPAWIAEGVPGIRVGISFSGK
ncbi:MAG: hypothetical protein EA360_09580 [Balneolaceae bacterium]|nr:MAG: hypothetical protein EA360_09580 [Balneolaceae bacterium]